MESLIYVLKQYLYYVPREYGLEWVEIVGVGCLAIVSTIGCIRQIRRSRQRARADQQRRTLLAEMEALRPAVLDAVATQLNAAE